MFKVQWVKVLIGCGIAVLLGGVAGCGISSAPFESPERNTQSAERERRRGGLERPGSQVEVRQLEDAARQEPTAIEIVWEVPAEPVDGFILRYGERREELVLEKRLRTDEVERRIDPERGALYRCVIEGIPKAQRVFLTIAAFKGDEVSPPSRVFEVAPGAP